MNSVAEYLGLLGDFQTDAKLAVYTTFRVGGECLGVFFPDSIDNLLNALHYLKENNISYKIFGKGSNILCSDDYYDGVIIKFDRYLEKYQREGQKIMAEAGCSIMNLAMQCANIGLSGLQFAGGIPGTIGGAVFMNAGAYRHEMSEIVNRVLIIDEYLQLRWLNFDECEFSYRSSAFQRNDWIIVQVEMIMDHLMPSHIHEIMRNRKEARVSTQPLDKPSAGSCFKNPGDKPAWQYIEEVGLRGYRVGGACVSEKHCNFIVNDQQGCASDVMAVILKVEEEVFKQKNVELKREVELFNWHEKE